jgi:hypothetical protein
MDFTDFEPPAAPLPLRLAIELQDDLLSACNDLERLQSLLSEAGAALRSGFHGVQDALEPPARPGRGIEAEARLGQARAQLGTAITALQFEDLATQLVEHTRHRLRSCVDRLARDALADDEDGVALVERSPQRANPVTQAEMNGGSVELF